MNDPIHNRKVIGDRFKATKRVITVYTVFRSDGGWSIYHCPDCRNPIAQYKGDIVAEIPGGVPNEYPIMVQCKNPNCGRKIMFKSSTEQVLSSD